MGFGGAFFRRCRAQSIESSESFSVVEPMAKMPRFRRKVKPLCFAYCVKDGQIDWMCAKTAQ